MKNDLQILIVEDDAIIGDSIHMHLCSLGHLPHPPVDNIARALEYIESGQVDLAFLDLRLSNDENGLTIARHIDEHHDIPYIYLTAYTDDHTLGEVTETQPAGFLVKPFRRNELKAAIAVARAARAKKETPAEQTVAPTDPKTSAAHIFVNIGGQWDRIEIKDILYLVSAHVYTEIHTVQGKKVTRKSLATLVEELEPHGIHRVHRSSAVNKHHVSGFDRHFLKVGAREFPMSASYKAEWLRRLEVRK